MKKYLGIVICFTLLSGLCACGQESQLETGPFRVTPISGFAFEEEGDTIYVPEIDVVGDEFSLGTDTGATVMIQAMEMHDGKINLFLSGNEAAADYAAEQFDQIDFVYPEVPDYMIRNLTGERLAGSSMDPEKKEWKGYIRETLKFSENPENFEVMIRFGEGDELLVNMVQAPVYNGFQFLENCGQTEYGALAVFPTVQGESVYFEPVIYGNEETSYQLILSEDPDVSLLDQEGNVILEEVPLTTIYRTDPYEMGNKVAYCVPKEVLEGHEEAILKFHTLTVTSDEVQSLGFNTGGLGTLTFPYAQGSVTIKEIEEEAEVSTRAFEVTYGDCENEDFELIKVSLRFAEMEKNNEIGMSYIMPMILNTFEEPHKIYLKTEEEDWEETLVEFHAPIYRWKTTLEVPISLR